MNKMMHCGERRPNPGRWLLSLTAAIAVGLLLTGSSLAVGTSLSGTDIAIENDANHDGAFSDVENVPKNATYPMSVTYRLTLTVGTAPATVKSIVDTSTTSLTSSHTSDCASLINTTVAAHTTAVCYYDATLSGPGAVPLVNTATLTYNAGGHDFAYDSSTINFPSMTIDKSSTTTLVTAAGQVVPYTYLVTNTGTGPLSGVSVSDNNVDSTPACPSSVLATGASVTCTGAHTVTAAELGAGSVSNTATATSNEAPDVSDSLTLPVAVFPVGGTFVVGDLTVGNVGQSTGKSVTFWGAQWWKLNSLSGGAGPAAFKGFEDSPAQPVCGVNWTSRPGNSTPPPAAIPAYMAVIVSSSITKSGATIGGDTLHLVIVRTDPGYEGNPGHAGTGTIVGVIC
jgi:uncharacterized repeat protein (TIGR01451 family)